MNYITHLNAWFEAVAERTDVNPTDMSLYLALFQLWNRQHFPASFTIHRVDVMRLSKIGSSNTYSKCMRRLVGWGWIVYRPSTSCYGKSAVEMLCMTTTSRKKRKGSGATTASTLVQSAEQSSASSSKQVVGHTYKTVKTVKTKENEENKISNTSGYDEAM